MTFASDDSRIFYLYNVRKNISSLQRKKTNINDNTTHLASSDLLKLGYYHRVKEFIFEDFVSFADIIPVGTRAYKFSSNLFGQIIDKMEYKGKTQFGYGKKDEGNKEFIVKVNPALTSQSCPLGVISKNKFLPWSSKERKEENYKVKTCKNYGFNTEEKKYISDKKGKTFIHSYKHVLDNIDYSSHDKKIDCDVSASIVLSYGHKYLLKLSTTSIHTGSTLVVYVDLLLAACLHL